MGKIAGGNKWKYFFYTLRPKQWIKNAFVLLPLVFGGKLFTFPVNLRVCLAAAIFSLASGVVYLANDLMDLEKDKVHPLKRLRPLASGKLKVKDAVPFLIVLAPLVIAAGFLLDSRFAFILAGYFLLNFLYTKILKEIVILDVFCVGIFFLLRISVGSLIAQVQLSHWILFMSTLLALFLAFNKRRQEIKFLGKEAATHRSVLAKYDCYFIDQIISVITSSIVVTYMLYTVDARTVLVFGTNHIMLTIPFVYYGIFRYLYVLQRHHKDGDPSRILLSDRPLQINLLAWMGVTIAVVYFGF